MQGSSESYELTVCPSFNSYSADKLVDVARRVSLEGGQKEGEEAVRNSEIKSEPTSAEWNHELNGGGGDGDGDAAEDDDFEFVSLVRNPDEVLINGGPIGLVFPVFNRDLLYMRDAQVASEKDASSVTEDRDDASSIRIPLKELFVEDCDPPVSCSSSEADELEGVPEGTYCVWTPKSSAQSSPSQCRKSNSTGSSSKRWRFRDLLRRSNSDGKDSFVFLTPSPSRGASSNSQAKGDGEMNKSVKEKKDKASTKEVVEAAEVRRNRPKEKAASSAHEAFYVRSRALKEGDKRRSYLPYRRDLVGFFASVNGLGKTFPPF